MGGSRRCGTYIRAVLLALSAAVPLVDAQLTLDSTGTATYAWKYWATNTSIPVRYGPFGVVSNGTHVNIIGGRTSASAATTFGTLTLSYSPTSVAPLREDPLPSFSAPLPAAAPNAKLDSHAGAAWGSAGQWFGFGGIGTTGAAWPYTVTMDMGTGTGNRLTVVNATGSVPPSVTNAAAAWLPNCDGQWNGCTVLFGGRTTSGGSLSNSVYKLVGSTWSSVATLGTPPPGRQGHSMVADAKGTTLYVYGGATSTGATSDLYALSATGYDNAAIGTESTNVALGKGGWISSIDQWYWTAGPWRATDGDIATNANPISNSTSYSANKCTRTAPIPGDAWLTIDLGAPRAIDVLRIYGRTDVSPKSAGFKIYVNNIANYTKGGAGFTSGMECPNPWADIQISVDIRVTGTRCALGQYIHMVLPNSTVNRVLYVCELQAWQRNPWQWRQLSGSTNVALNKVTSQVSTNGIYASSLAVDGIHNNGIFSTTPYTCSQTLNNTNDASKPGWFVLDLGDNYDITSIDLYPRRDSCCRADNLRWNIAIGPSRDWASTVNSRCGGVPADVTPSSGYVTSVPCAARGRFVVVWRTYKAGDNNMLTICDIKVNGNALSYEPAARTAHAAATFRGHMVVFGGQDTRGVPLNDLRMFSYADQSWLPSTSTVPVNTPPSARAYTLLHPLSPTQLLLFGGQTAIDETADIWTLEFSGCSAYSNRSAAVSRSLWGGSSLFVNCTGGFTPANDPSTTPIVCLPDGKWSGSFPVCKGRVPSPPRAVAAQPIDDATALVTWQPPSFTGDGASGVTSYTIQTVTEGYYNRFSTPYLPSDWATAWSWNNGGGYSSYAFDGDNLVINGMNQEDCYMPPWRCPFLTRTWPTGVDANDWAVETRVQMQDPGSAPSSVMAGLVLHDLNTGAPSVYGGLRYYSTGVFQVGIESVNQVGFKTWYTLSSTQNSVYFRFTRTSNDNTYQGWYKLTETAQWIRLPMQFNSTAGYTGVLASPPNKLNVGFIVKNWNSNTRAFVKFDYLRISNRTCVATGVTRVVDGNATSANVTGLTDSGRYMFTVTASNEFGTSSPSNSSNKATIQPPSPAAFMPLVEVARGKPVTLSTTATHATSLLPYSGSLAVDGVFTQVDNTATPACARTLTESTPWARIDLGTTMDVQRVGVWGRSDGGLTAMDDFEVYVGTSWSTDLDIRCPQENVPTTLATPPYRGSFNCSALGRYVIIKAVQGQAMSLCEVQVWAANKCPDRTTSPNSYIGGASQNCRNASLGQICIQGCNAGYTGLTGTGTGLCRGASWDIGSTVCEASCPALAAPAEASVCAYSQVAESFTDPLDWIGLGTKWGTGVPWLQPSDYWTVADGALQAVGSPGCGNDQSFLNRVSGYGYRGNFDLSVGIRTSDRAGIVFRAAGETNYYRMTMDVQKGFLWVDRYYAGTTTRLVDAYLRFTLDPSAVHTVLLQYTPTLFTFYVDGEQVMVAADETSGLQYGLQGVYAASTAEFHWFNMTLPCSENVGCPALTHGRTCTFACRQGFILTGSAARTCTWTNRASSATNYTGSAAICTLPPPVFFPAIRSIAENSPINTQVGAALVATITAPDLQVTYQITSGNGFNAFWIGQCDGILRVKNSSALDYERTRVYTLTVRAFIQGYVGAETSVPVTVNLLNVVEKPIIPDQTFNVSEAAPLGTLIAVPYMLDVENTRYTWAVVADSSAGRLAVNSTTGAISVSRTSPLRLDYEQTQTYTLSLTVTNFFFPSLVVGCTMTITVTDANDPPYITTGTISVIESALPSPFIGTSFDQAIGADDQDNWNVGGSPGTYAGGYTYSLIPTNNTNYNRTGVCRVAGNGTVITHIPTTTGAATTGSPLFTINPSTGNVTFIALPSGLQWYQIPPFIASGQLLRRNYLLCVNVTDPWGAWSVAAVQAQVVANIPGQPVINAMSVNAQAMNTSGGDRIVFTGNNMGTIAQRRVITAFYTDGFTRYNATNCTITVDDTQVTCIAVAGVGSSLIWRVFRDSGATEMTPTIPLTSSYAMPVVDTVTGGGALATEGNNLITFTGGNFGPPGTAVEIRYGRNYEYVCNHVPNAGTSQTVVQCRTAVVSTTYGGSSGANLPWRITVPAPPTPNGQVLYSGTADSARLLTHTPPTVSSLAVAVGGTRLNSIDTIGGLVFWVYGTNFGPLGNPITVTYGGTDGRLLAALNCVHLTSVTLTYYPHRKLECTAGPGVGANLKVLVTADGIPALSPTSGIASSSQGLSYRFPQFINIIGTGRDGGSTQGGAVFTVRGYHFGPMPGVLPFNPIDWVKYGPADNPQLYTATDCRVTSAVAYTVDRSTFDCNTAPGIGSGHSITISIGGQVLGPVSNLINYGAPVVGGFTTSTAADVQSLLTTGGDVVYIDGYNFGPQDAYTNARLNVSYGTRLVDGPFETISFQAANCTVSIPHLQLACVTAPGAGKNMQWSVSVAGVASTRPTTQYCPPTITSLYVTDPSYNTIPAANVDGGSYVVVSGSCFGPSNFQGSGRSLLSSVTFGRYGTEYWAVAAGVASDTLMVFSLPPGIGTSLVAQIQVADQLSAVTAPPVAFSYALPVVKGVYPSTNIPTYTAPDAPPSTITVVASNVPIYDSLSLVHVLLGTGSYSLLVPVAVPTSASGIASITNADGSRNFTIALPREGAGMHIGVRIGALPAGAANTTAALATSVGTFSTVTSNATATYSYGSPAVYNTAVTRPRFAPLGFTGNFTGPYAGSVACPFAANDPSGWSCNDTSNPIFLLTLDGANFGASPSSANDGVTRLIEIVSSVDNATGVETWTSAQSFIYTFVWSHKQIQAFVRSITGKVRVSLTSTGYGGETNVQSTTTVFADFSPSVSGLQGATTGIPTEGYAPGDWSNPLVISLQHLDGAVNLVITVGNATCPLWCSSRNDTCASPAEVKADVIDSGYTGIGVDAVWTVKCRPPPGQGVGRVVQVLKTTQGQSVLMSAAVATVDYAPPTLTAVSVQQADGTWTTTPFVGTDPVRTAVTIPTVGTRLRLQGYNLGTAPQVFVGDGWLLSSSALQVTSCAAPDPSGLARHTCYEFAAPAGEGTGLQYPEYQAFGYGYKTYLIAGGQASDFALIRYHAPTVTAVTSASGSFPTAGGAALTIIGSDFGATTPGRPAASIIVTFTMPWLDGQVLTCGNATRVNHTAITCTLPEGSGVGLQTTVQVADQTGSAVGLFSYNRPVITALSVVPGTPEDVGSVGLIPPYLAWASRPFAQVTKGSYLTITGTDLGSWMPGSNCLFLAWTFRTTDASRRFTCNGLEDHLGEGEVSSFNVTSWNHTSITIVVPAGVGCRDVELYVRGNMLGIPRISALQWHVSYAPPIVTALYAVDVRSYPVAPSYIPGGLPIARGDTDGTLMVLEGKRLGITPMNMTGPNALRTEIFSSLPGGPIPLWLAPSLPQTAMQIDFHRSCVSMATNVYGLPAVGTSLCYRADSTADAGSGSRGVGIVLHTEELIVFWAPAGVGVNRTVRVSFREADGSVYVSSNPAVFSFMPPVITNANPSTVFMGTDNPGLLTIYGRQFGNPELADRQGWDVNDRRVGALVGGLECISTVALRQEGATVVQCNLPWGVTVGYQNITVRIAGQTGFVGTSPRYSTAHFVCKVNTFGRIGETCALCPSPGAKCYGYLEWLDTGDLADKHTYPRPLPGFYNLNGTERSGCPDTLIARDPVTASRDVCIVACSPPESCLGENYCAYGYASKPPMFRCASCANGFYMRSGQCARCPDSPAAQLVGFFLIVLAAAGLGFFLNSKGVNIAMISIGVDFLQVIAIFGNARIKYPQVVKDFLAILQAFNLNIEIVAPECIVPDMSYKKKFFAILLIPISIIGLFILTSVVISLVKLIKGRRGKDVWLSHISPLISAFLMLFYFVYLYISRTLLEIFNCTPTQPPDGKTYLQVVFEECGVPGGTQMSLLPWAALGFVIYTAGYPVGIGYWLWKNRETVMEDQLLRALNQGEDRLTGPRTYDFRRRYGRSYYQFKPDFAPYWILTIIVRKFCIAASAVLFNQNSAFQMAACLLVVFACYGLQVRFTPYMSPSEREEAVKAHEAAVFTSAIHGRLKSKLQNVRDRSRKKTRKNLLTADGKLDRSAVLGVLGAWWASYNTLEAVMLWCSVIVCLLTIMYQTTHFNIYYNDEAATDSITAVLMIVIIFALTYFVALVVTEIVVLLNEKREEAALKKGVRRPSSARGTLKSSGLGKGDDAIIGPIEAQANPLFFSGAGGKDGAAKAMGSGASAKLLESAHEAVMSLSAPPSQDLWIIFQSSFGDMVKDVNKLREGIADTKVKLQKTSDSLRYKQIEETASSSRTARGSVRGLQKTAFQPAATYGSSKNVTGAGGGSRRSMAASASAGGGGATSVTATLAAAGSGTGKVNPLSLGGRRKSMNSARARSTASQDDE